MPTFIGDDTLDDDLIGSETDDEISGLGGNDTLSGLGGNDLLEGGDGNDRLDGGDGDDTMLGGDARDIFDLNSGDDTAFGGSGSDIFRVAGASGDELAITDTQGDNEILDFYGGATGALVNLTAGSTSSVDGRTIWVSGPSEDDVDQRLELVIVQDLSGSFSDDLNAVKSLGDDLVDALASASTEVALGLASYIDKPTSPFGSSGDHEYETESALTTDYDAWLAALNSLSTGSGGDYEESQMTALLQVALRTEEIGWSDDSLKVVVLTSDATPHFAGDHPVGANDGDDVTDGPGDDGTGEDYPSLEQVKSALLAAGIIPVFAVTSGVKSDYEGIVDEFGFGAVVQLSSNSSDLIEAIEDGLSLATETIIETAIGTVLDDEMLGNDANNVLKGRAGNDVLEGGLGADTLLGGLGIDDLRGGSGFDVLDGGRGRDFLLGGTGADVFQFKLFEANAIDQIADFEDGRDTIRILDSTLHDFSDIGIRADGTDVILDLGGTDFARLIDTTLAEIDASDFTFGFV